MTMDDALDDAEARGLDRDVSRVVLLAVVAERKRITDAVQAMESSCHSRSGLMCDYDEYGRDTTVDRADVIGIVNAPETA